MYLSDLEARNMICSIGRKMYEKQFVAANDGNITIRTGERTVIATPTGVSKGDITPDMLLKVDFDGNVLEGGLKVTSEIYMHLNVYRNNNEIQSTCHAHPIFLSAFASAGIEPDLAISAETAAIVGKIPVAPYCCPGTEMLAKSVIPYVNDYNIVLLSNHGPVAWGKKPIDAWFCLEAAEAYCKSSILLKYIIKELRPLSHSQLNELIAFQHLDMKDGRRVTTGDNNTNLGTPKSLSSIDSGALTLDDATLERLAELVADKLRKK